MKNIITPKETAWELVNEFSNMESWCDDAKECALIAVNHIMKVYDNSNKTYIPVNWDVRSYYNQVKEEIVRL